MCSQEPVAGEMLAIMTVRESPRKESRSTSVSLLPRKGTWLDPMSSARMHSFSASSDLLISAPSSRVCRSFWSVSAPLSLPARSMKENLPWIAVWFAPSFALSCLATEGGILAAFGSTPSRCFSESWRIACERDDSELAPVLPVHLAAVPCSMSRSTSVTLSTSNSCSPTTHICCLASSRITSFFRPLSKS